jgi:hypothetical protein
MNKVLLIFGVAIIGFAIVLAGSIGARLDQPTVTLLIGVTCGVGLALPIGLAAGLYIADRRKPQPQSLPQPIVIMQPPTQSPVVNNPPLLQSEFTVSTPRSFNIIGDAEK